MPDFKFTQTCQEDKESKESSHGSRWHPTYKTVTQSQSQEGNRGEVEVQHDSYEVLSIMCLGNSRPKTVSHSGQKDWHQAMTQDSTSFEFHSAH